MPAVCLITDFDNEEKRCLHEFGDCELYCELDEDEEMTIDK